MSDPVEWETAEEVVAWLLDSCDYWTERLTKTTPPFPGRFNEQEVASEFADRPDVVAFAARFNASRAAAVSGEREPQGGTQ